MALGALRGPGGPWKSRQRTLLAVYCTTRCRRFLRSAGAAADWPAVGARQRRPWIDMCKAAKQQLPIRGRWSTVYLVYGSVRRDLKAIAATLKLALNATAGGAINQTHPSSLQGTPPPCVEKGKHAARAGKAPKGPLPDSAAVHSICHQQPRQPTNRLTMPVRANE